MASLDRIIERQQQGKSDAEITIQLQNEGVSPTEINDSINQAKVKNAVAPPEIQPAPAAPEGMQSSLTEQPQAQQVEMPAPITPPPTQEATPAEQPSEEQPQDYYQQTPQAYPDQDYYSQQAPVEAGTISEIAQQVATETIEDYKAKVGDVASFKNQIQDKVNDIDDRLKRIESSIDKLQQAVIGKIGEFGESSAMIHKDLDNLHGTVAKLMNPLIDNVNEMKKLKK